MSEEVRLRHLAWVNPPAPKFDALTNEDEVTFLPMESVWPGVGLDTSTLRYKGAVSTGYTRFQDGDVLVPKITPTFEAARAVLIDGLHNSTGAGTTELHVLRAGPRLDPRYLFYIVNTHSFLKFGESAMYGVAGQKRVPDEFIRNLKVELPSLDEQRRIADFLDAELARIDDVSQIRVRQADLVNERMKTALVREILTGEHVTHWSRSRLKYLFESTQNGTWGDEPGNSDPEVVCVRVADFARDRYCAGKEAETKRSIPSSHLSSKKLAPGDVLLEKSGGGDSNPVGFAVSFDGRERSVCSNFVAALRPSSNCNPRFTALLMAALYRSGRNVPFIKQTTGIQNLDSAAYLSQPVRVPDKKTQGHIAKALDDALDKSVHLVGQQRTQLDRLTERRQALITAAVTGQIDVSTAGDVRTP